MTINNISINNILRTIFFFLLPFFTISCSLIKNEATIHQKDYKIDKETSFYYEASAKSIKEAKDNALSGLLKSIIVKVETESFNNTSVSTDNENVDSSSFSGVYLSTNSTGIIKGIEYINPKKKENEYFITAIFKPSAIKETILHIEGNIPQEKNIDGLYFEQQEELRNNLNMLMSLISSKQANTLFANNEKNRITQKSQKILDLLSLRLDNYGNITFTFFDKTPHIKILNKNIKIETNKKTYIPAGFYSYEISKKGYTKEKNSFNISSQEELIIPIKIHKKINKNIKVQLLTDINLQSPKNNNEIIKYIKSKLSDYKINTTSNKQNKTLEFNLSISKKSGIIKNYSNLISELSIHAKSNVNTFNRTNNEKNFLVKESDDFNLKNIKKQISIEIDNFFSGENLYKFSKF